MTTSGFPQGAARAAVTLLLITTLEPSPASHRLGSVLNIAPMVINGASGVVPFGDANPITKYLVLHFSSSTLEGSDQLVVTLGYDTDVFDASSGTEFWTRPVNGAATTITYVDDGDGIGSVTLNLYGRGEESDVFLLSTPYMNPEVLFDHAVCPVNSAPSWQNVRCLDPSIPAEMTMSNVARATGMILMVGPPRRSRVVSSSRAVRPR
ncbi:MAG: hypothetical protein L0Y58_16820 [Verrucomicrobia subdivision 3 bacterium]|nr:hypothetical protein [Limisphaerales bacterium]